MHFLPPAAQRQTEDLIPDNWRGPQPSSGIIIVKVWATLSSRTGPLSSRIETGLVYVKPLTRYLMS